MDTYTDTHSLWERRDKERDRQRDRDREIETESDREKTLLENITKI